MREDDLNEIKSVVSRAVGAAYRSIDYPILLSLIDTSKRMKDAHKKGDYDALNYFNNKWLWEIGKCIQKKISNYSVISSNFFEDIEKNILLHLKLDKQLYFSSENLMRSLKLVELVDEEWFESVANKITWSFFVVLLDEFNSAEEVKRYINYSIAYKWSLEKLTSAIESLRRSDNLS